MISSKNKYVDGMNGVERAIKRAFDIVASLCGLIVLSPAFSMLFTVFAVRPTGRSSSVRNVSDVEGDPLIF